MAKSKKWVVTTSGDRPLSEVQQQLSEAGFAIDQVLDAVGCITGSASESTVKRLRTVSGISDISPEPAQINIGPPDAPIS